MQQNDEQRSLRPLEEVQRGREGVVPPEVHTLCDWSMLKVLPCQIKTENDEKEVAVVGEVVGEEEDDQIMIAYRYGLPRNQTPP